MFSLDFKLTGAQVKALLVEWHGHHFWDGPRPARDLFYTEQGMHVRRTLCRKGLLEVVGAPAFAHNPEHIVGFEVMRCTPAGAALAEHIVMQAQKIMALDASRREFIADLPRIEAEYANARPEPIDVPVYRRSPEDDNADPR